MAHMRSRWASVLEHCTHSTAISGSGVRAQRCDQSRDKAVPLAASAGRGRADPCRAVLTFQLAQRLRHDGGLLPAAELAFITSGGLNVDGPDGRVCEWGPA